MTNIMNWIDAYKFDHRRQYPEGTTQILSNFTPRTSRIEGIDSVVFFGLQIFLDQFHEAFRKFFAGDIDAICEEYQTNLDQILGPNNIGTDHIRELHELGYVPLEFKAVPEGYSVPLRVPMFTVENTDPRFFWLVNYFESAISAAVWLPCTSATQAKRMRDLLLDWADQTGTPEAVVDFQLHDFSFRGLSSIESAGTSGAAHLLSFLGSDSIVAKDVIQKHYYDNSGEVPEPVLLSVAATEHSVMCAGGAEPEDEQATYEHLLDLYPTGIVSVVSDTWDLWSVLTVILPNLKDKIMARDGKLVIRPDSGDPADILCGLNTSSKSFAQYNAGNDVNAVKGVIEILWEIFGGTVNDAGFKELDPHIGAIYGDSITYERADDICRRLADKGFASGNVVFGVGSYTYQYVTRDTFGFAMKATNVVINGEERAIFKDPITDNGTKKSAKGRVAVLFDDSLEDFVLEDQLSTEELDYLDASGKNYLQTVYVDGNFSNRLDFATIKANVRT